MPRCTMGRPSVLSAMRWSANSDCSRRPSRERRVNSRHEPRKRKPPRKRGFLIPRLTDGLFLPEAAELLLEAREASATVHQVLLAAGPRRVRLRVDVEIERIARFA